MTLQSYYLTLHCSGKIRGVQVQVRYQNPNQPEAFMTVGTLHLAHPLLVTLVLCLRRGGMLVTMTGPYLEKHSDLHNIGKV